MGMLLFCLQQSAWLTPSSVFCYDESWGSFLGGSVSYSGIRVYAHTIKLPTSFKTPLDTIPQNEEIIIRAKNEDTNGKN